MGITVIDLNTLDATQVAQFEATLSALLLAYDPAIDLKSGPFHDLLLHLKAVTDTATQENITLVLESNSLEAINANPTLADPTIVAACVSNFNLTPSPGTEASGVVTIVLNQLIGTVIPQGSTFTINGLTFVSPVTYAGRTSSSAVVGPNDRLISSIGGGLYAFMITLNANAVGTAYNVPRAYAVTPASPPAAFSSAYVASDFTGGTDADTVTSLLSKLASGMAIAAWSNRVSIMSLLLDQPAFSLISSTSIIGFGDIEMLRDQHQIWPGHTGGRSDLYLRSQGLYLSYSFPVTATLISAIGPLGTWQFGIGKDDAPGFYQVDRILLPNVNQSCPGFAATSDVRGYNLADGVTGPPDIITLNEAIYSRYQTAVIQFVDTVTDASGLTPGVSTQVYNCVARMMPLVDQVQDFLLDRSVRPPMCDVEVKAPIPCFTSISLTVNYDSTKTPPTVAAVQTAVANGINALNFPGSISASLVNQIVHNMIDNVVSVTSVSLNGTIRNIDGTTTPLSSPSVITIPSTPALMLSGRTAAFFVQPADVTVTLVPVVVPSV